jgi:hypothetical protein
MTAPEPPLFPLGGMPFEPPVTGPFVGPVVIIVDWDKVSREIEWLRQLCSQSETQSLIRKAQLSPTEEARRAIQIQTAVLVFKSRLKRDNLRILFRGVNYKRAWEPRSWLFVTEDISYAAWFATTDPVGGTIDPAIAIYAISEKTFQGLRASGNILTNKDYKRYIAGKDPLYLDQKVSREWVLSAFAQTFLVGPTVVRVPTNFTG